MAKSNKNDELQFSHIKILVTVKFLNDLGYYPQAYGVYKILLGSVEDIYFTFRYCPTYQTLTSYSAKKIALMCARLKNSHYLEEIFDTVNQTFYLKLSDFGLDYLSSYYSIHSPKFKKSDAKEKPAIAFIGDN